MDPLIGILVAIYVVLGFCIAYSTSVEITLDGPVEMVLTIGASHRRVGLLRYALSHLW